MMSVPDINFAAEDYSELVDWDKVVVTPLPLVGGLTDDQLHDFIPAGTVEVLPLPCHTQAVERFVHEVTQAAQKTVGEERRDGLVRTKTSARNAMPKFGSKKDFDTK